jgi:hypothetical protein
MVAIKTEINRDENTASQNGDPSKDLTHETKEAKESHCVEADFVEELGLLGMEQRWKPTAEGIAYAWGRFISNMVFHLGLVDNLNGVKRCYPVSEWPYLIPWP